MITPPLKHALLKHFPVCTRRNLRHRTNVTDSAGGSLLSTFKASQCFSILKECCTVRDSETNTPQLQPVLPPPSKSVKLVWLTLSALANVLEKTHTVYEFFPTYEVWFIQNCFQRKRNLGMFTPLTSHFYC